jgi:hypothetical protein
MRSTPVFVLALALTCLAGCPTQSEAPAAAPESSGQQSPETESASPPAVPDEGPATTVPAEPATEVAEPAAKTPERATPVPEPASPPPAETAPADETPPPSAPPPAAKPPAVQEPPVEEQTPASPPPTKPPAVVDPGGVIEVAATKPGLTRFGAEKCKLCHKLQYASWAETAHAKRTPPLDCESCHGPGSEYKTKKVMEDPALARAAGLVIPERSFCVQCHTPASWSDDLLKHTHAHKDDGS